MDYEITVNSDHAGLLRCDSPDAKKYLTPVVGPLGMSLVHVLADLGSRANDGYVAQGEDLARRCGAATDKITRSLDRLSRHRIVDLEVSDEGTTAVQVHQWVDPPRARARTNHYSPALLDEYNDFIDDAELRLVEAPAAIVRASPEPPREAEVEVSDGLDL